MKLAISPHNDDAALYLAFTLMRKKPLVLTVTDAWKQFNRGENITSGQRWLEDIEAMKMLGCPLINGDIRDDVIDEWSVIHLLQRFKNFDQVYAPAVQNGNPDHNLIAKVAKEIFGDRCKQYTTYSETELYTTGSEEVKPTSEEIILKHNALNCYKSQINLPATKPHFDAVMGGKSEWFI
jgi:LmbE family N-acetylglucosaminyl deacetylase